ncbi:MAG TPA: aldehyde dehydrogenase family protein [Gallionella sp.]|nr:aldehyde dehydrogenase family protein [Gallionella sp.]
MACRRHQARQPARHRDHDGAQASQEQLAKNLSHLDVGKQEGATVLAGGAQAHLGGDLEGGYYVQPTLSALFLEGQLSEDDSGALPNCRLTRIKYAVSQS